MSPADRGLLGASGARAVWAVLWVGASFLELGAANHDPRVPGAEIQGLASGEPGWLRWLDHGAGHLLAGRGAAFAVAAGLAQTAIGIGIFWPRSRRLVLAAGMVLGVTYGLVGQNFGGILSGQGTDPASGPLLVLLALCLWPHRGFQRIGRVGAPSTRSLSTTPRSRPLHRLAGHPLKGSRGALLTHNGRLLQHEVSRPAGSIRRITPWPPLVGPYR